MTATNGAQPVSTLAVTPTLVADQVYDVIERAILSGELPAGSRLRVRNLAEMVGTSIMPVRDAIRHLEEVGLAERTPHKGAVVRDFSVHELIDIYRVRTVLEIEGARVGATRVTADGLAVMERDLAEMRRAVEEKRISDALDADERVLRTLYAAGDNPVLVNMIEMLWKQCRYYKVMGATVAVDKDDNTLWEPQPLIFEAAKAGDAEAAARITEESLLSAQKRLEDRLNS